MRIEVGAFPAIYLNTTCGMHKTNVSARIEPSKPFQSDVSIGAQVTTLSCPTGGPAATAECTSRWVATISGGGPIIITN